MNNQFLIVDLKFAFDTRSWKPIITAEITEASSLSIESKIENVKVKEICSQRSMICQRN